MKYATKLNVVFELRTRCGMAQAEEIIGRFGGGYERTMWLLNLHGGGNVPDERMWSKAALSLTQVSAVSLNWNSSYCRINPLGY